MKTGSTLFVAISTVVLFVGCGGGSGNGGSGGSGGSASSGNGGNTSGGFQTSVPGGAEIDKLTPAQAAQFCMDTNTYLTAQLSSGALTQSACLGAGADEAGQLASSPSATDAQVQQACAAGYQLCETLFADGGIATIGQDGGTVDCSDTTPPVDCNATISQYQACLNEQLSSMETVYPPCAQLTKAKAIMLAAMLDSDAGAAPTTLGPACKAFQTACPGVDITSSTSALKIMQH